MLADALAEAFAAGADVPLRHVHTLGGAGDRLLLMPAWRRAEGGADARIESIGVKIVTVFPGNPARGARTVGATYLLLDGATGAPCALIDGDALTARRTAAVSALAARFLARRDASRLLVIGTGRLAPAMARAHCELAAARGAAIEEVRVWGRRAQAAAEVAGALAAEGLPARAAADLDAAIARADIVCAATTATTPIVHGAVVRPGTHVDLVGAFTPQMVEADDALIARAALYVDTRRGALAEAGEIVGAIARGVITAASVRAELAELVHDPSCGRRGEHEITVFKSVGTGLADLAAARLVWSYHARGNAR